MDRIVIDTEGRVSELLGCGDDQMWRGTRRYRESRPGKGLGLLPEIIEEVAALPSSSRKAGLRAGRPKASPTRPSVSYPR